MLYNKELHKPIKGDMAKPKLKYEKERKNN
jgi:hypothetical protein